MTDPNGDSRQAAAPAPQTGSFWQRHRPALQPLAAGLLCLAAASGSYLLVFALAPGGAEPLPRMFAASWLLLTAGAALLLASLVKRVRAKAAGKRWWHTLVACVLVAIVVVAGAFGTLVADDDILFRSSHEVDLQADGVAQSFHVYRGGLLCTRQLMESADGMWAYPVTDYRRMACAGEAHMSYDKATGTVIVTDAKGQPVKPPPKLSLGFVGH